MGKEFGEKKEAALLHSFEPPSRTSPSSFIQALYYETLLSKSVSFCFLTKYLKYSSIFPFFLPVSPFCSPRFGPKHDMQIDILADAYLRKHKEKIGFPRQLPKGIRDIAAVHLLADTCRFPPGCKKFCILFHIGITSMPLVCPTSVPFHAS